MEQPINKPIWRSPKPSRAKLKIPKKSSKHFVGQTTFGDDKGQGQCLGFGSVVENMLSCFDMRQMMESNRLQFISFHSLFEYQAALNAPSVRSDGKRT